MKKSGLLAEIQRIETMPELQEMSEENARLKMLAIIDALLTYGNDPQIREAVERIPF